MARIKGQHPTFIDLVRPEFLGSREGSSLIELKKAAEHCGLQGEVVGNRTIGLLRNCPYPVIMHVKASPKDRKYNHYVLYLGTAEGKAMILDARNRCDWWISTT